MMKMFNYALLISALLISNALGAPHLDVFKVVDEVFEKKSDALNLKEVKELAAGDSIDVGIAYERLIQAQKRISQARARYFPYTLGSAAAIYFGGAWSNLMLVELLTSLPMKWYDVREAKSLSTAQFYNRKALRLNIQNQAARIYYTLLKEQALLKLAQYELQLLDVLVDALKVKEQAGLVSIQEVESAERRYFSLKDEFFRFSAYVEEEKTALRELLNLKYDHVIKLQPEPEILTKSDYEYDLAGTTELALENSYEVKASISLVNAAFYAKRSTQWSILSFSGIGFSYLNNVRYSGSLVDEAIYRRELTNQNIQNSIYTTRDILLDTIGVVESEVAIMELTKGFVTSRMADFKAGTVAVDELIDDEFYFIRDFREMVIAHYTSLIRKDDFQRAALIESYEQINGEL